MLINLAKYFMFLEKQNAVVQLGLAKYNWYTSFAQHHRGAIDMCRFFPLSNREQRWTHDAQQLSFATAYVLFIFE